jgi:hypothetical protein
MNLTIKGKDITLKYGYRPLMIYENITKKSFNPSGLTDLVYFFYSCVLTQFIKSSDNIGYDEFMDWLDDNPEKVQEFSNWLIDTLNTQKDISPEQTNKGDGKGYIPKN